jgi:hypothetical protein
MLLTVHFLKSCILRCIFNAKQLKQCSRATLSQLFKAKSTYQLQTKLLLSIHNEQKYCYLVILSVQKVSRLTEVEVSN